MDSTNLENEKPVAEENTSGKISFAQISLKVKETLGENTIPIIYREKIRAQRTRSIALQIEAKENRTEIQHTLLGVELKVGKQRISCPDLATARYLQVFARLGCALVAVPYDISRISNLADELESSWQIMLLLIGQLNSENGVHLARIRTFLIREIRKEIIEIGAGDAMPQFNQNTKQRN